MNPSKKRMIFIRTPHVVYDESPLQTPYQALNSKSANNLMDYEKIYEPSVSYKQIEKLKKDLIKFERLDLKEHKSHFDPFNRNLSSNSNSKLVIRPKMNENYSKEKIHSLLVKKNSIPSIDYAYKFNSVNKYTQNQRASKFFFKPKQKSNDCGTRLFMERIRTRVYISPKKYAGLA